MKSKRLFPCLTALVVLLTVSSASAKPGWMTDLKEAQAEAKANHKLLLVDFTGSDWCGWCIRLDREVFSKPEFQDYAKKNLVLLEIDFPRGKELSPELRLQNEQFAQKNAIQGLPTILVFDGEGKKVGALGYMPGGPQAFLAELDRLPKS